jgi:hypothetical protein
MKMIDPEVGNCTGADHQIGQKQGISPRRLHPLTNGMIAFSGCKYQYSGTFSAKAKDANRYHILLIRGPAFIIFLILDLVLRDLLLDLVELVKFDRIDLAPNATVCSVFTDQR